MRNGVMIGVSTHLTLGSSRRSNVFQGAAAAFSTRIPAGSTYSGPLIRVRRSSDNTEANFGVAPQPDANGNRWLDTTSLLSFCSGGSGFVTTWYDQSGNGRNATQATAANQPRIVNAGAVDTDGGRAAVRFLQASNTSVLLPLTGAFDASWSANIVVRTDPRPNADWSDFVGTKTFVTGDGWFVRRGGAASTTTGDLAANVAGAGVQKNVIASSLKAYPYRETVTLVRDTNLLSLFSLGVLAASDSTITAAMQPSEAAPVRIGGITSRAHEGTVSEIVIFSAGLSTVDRQTLERNQGAAFGITVA